MPFPTKGLAVGRSRPFRKLTRDIDGVETDLPFSAVFEWQKMTSGSSRLLINAPPDRPELFRALADQLSAPLFLLYLLHTPHSEGSPGRYLSPALSRAEVDEFLGEFEAYLAGDGRHDLWVHSAGDQRTLVWDRHNMIFAEGEALEEISVALERMGFKNGDVPRVGAAPHVHYYRTEFDTEAAAVLARFSWTRSDLRPGDEQ